MPPLTLFKSDVGNGTSNETDDKVKYSEVVAEYNVSLNEEHSTWNVKKRYIYQWGELKTKEKTAIDWDSQESFVCCLSLANVSKASVSKKWTLSSPSS